MKKVILFAVIALMGTAVNAQKFGHINSNDLMAAMPETKKAQAKMQKMQDSLNVSYADLIKEYNEKDSIIRTDSGKWTPAKKDIKFKEYSDLRESIQNYSTAAQQYLQQEEQKLYEPIRRIVTEAIQAVAKTNGYTYVFAAEALYVSPASDDILPLVKKYLKIPDAPPGK
ncbi:MAG: OmpH family outer membrane protein [Chitinophagaceae bacterium]|nr:OmpH family outer membrane protein [Chitinophagaceae bacterium]